jgi:hypothetical protein
MMQKFEFVKDDPGNRTKIIINQVGRNGGEKVKLDANLKFVNQQSISEKDKPSDIRCWSQRA